MPRTSEAQICNVALSRIGSREFIDSLSEDNTQAEVCSALYNPALEGLLATHPWAFATRQDVLALTALERTDWLYVYALPTACITARYLWTGARAPPSDTRIPFALQDDATIGTVLLTDLEEAELIYTARITRSARYPPLFTEALAWKLAGELALALKVDPGTAVAMERQFEAALNRACAADMNQGQEDQLPQAEHIRAR